MDEAETTALRQLILTAVTQCTDPDLLDLVYKLLTYDTIK